MIRARLTVSRPSGFNLDVSLEFHKGVTALYGPSGAGKSTILRFVAGLAGAEATHVDITSNDIAWHTKDVFLPTHKRHVGYVFQQPQLFSHLSVEGNLTYALGRAEGKSAASWDQVCDWLDLAPLLKRDTQQLSGGEAQRVAIGRALLGHVECLLMDEPLGSIDVAARARILPYLDRLHRRLDIPMVYVSHALDEVNFLADRVYLIEAGEITSSGTIIETSSSLEFNREQGDVVAAVLDCRVKDYKTEYGLAEVSVGTHSMFVTTPAIETGALLRLRVSARDVSIATDRPSNTSILNIVPAIVDDVAIASSSALLRLAVADQFLLARITTKSLAQLDIQRGQSVFAQIKGIALISQHG